MMVDQMKNMDKMQECMNIDVPAQKKLRLLNMIEQ